MEPKKKVLMIACYFPPMGGSGVQRSTKFVKYLSQFGWEPVVLTTNHPMAASKDETLLREIPAGITVVRTKHFDIAERYAQGDAKKGSEIKTAPLSAGAKPAPVSASEPKETPVKKFLKWLKTPLRRVVNFPDRKVGWLPWALPEALRLIRKHDPELIYITGDPFSSFLMAPVLKFLTGKPYVLDFRDEWTACLSAPGNIFGRSKRSGLEEWLEKWVIRGASRVVTVTDMMVENFRRNNPEEPAEKFVCIENGYDSEDFKPLQSKKNGKNDSNIFTMTYVGMLGPLHFERSFFEAFQQWMTEEPSLAGKVRVNFVGRIWDSLYSEAATYQSGNLQMHGYLPHAQAVDYLCQSDVLLLLLTEIPGLERAMSGKIYEYIAAGKPILAVTPDGEVRQFIETCRRGIHVKSGDTAGVRKALEKLYRIYREGGDFASHYDLGPIPRKERRYQAGLLADVFNELADAKKNSREMVYA